MKSLALISGFVTAIVIATNAVASADSVCIVDVNHNGVLDSGEMFTCESGKTVNGTDTAICPIGKTECKLQACPPGTLYYDNKSNTCYLPAKRVKVYSNPFYPTYRWTCSSGTLTYQNPAGLPYPTCALQGNTTNYVCPLGDNYSCVRPEGGNSYYCSPNACIQQTTLESNKDNLDTQEGATDKKADGTIDSSGRCHGNVYIFNGEDMRCRLPGLETAWTNCCNDYTYLFGLASCTKKEIKLAALKDVGKRDGRCHEVGTYCAWKVKLPLGGSICLQKKKTYCCFNSVLAKVIQEQGRKQLGLSWGTPEAPNCRGFTPEEFQKLDFSRMDLSDWFNDLEKELNKAIANFSKNATQQMTNYLNEVTK